MRWGAIGRRCRCSSRTTAGWRGFTIHFRDVAQERTFNGTYLPHAVNDGWKVGGVEDVRLIRLVEAEMQKSVSSHPTQESYSIPINAVDHTCAQSYTDAGGDGT